MEQRLQKILSAQGIASRRDAEEMILQGRVKVNGEAAVLGQRANPESDSIEVDGVLIQARPPLVYIMLNKPEGYVTTMRDEKGRKTVRDLISGVKETLHPVGRLDINSSGLLLMTNDGDLTNRLTHPSFGVKKMYKVWVEGEDIQGSAESMSRKMMIDGYEISPAQIKIMGVTGNKGVLTVTIHEGRNRQVRKMCGIASLSVKRLVRIAEGELKLGDLQRGKWRYLKDDEIKYLQNLKNRIE